MFASSGWTCCENTPQSRDEARVDGEKSHHSRAPEREAIAHARRSRCRRNQGAVVGTRRPVPHDGFLGSDNRFAVSELLGLKWRDINFDTLEIHLVRAIVNGVVGDMKTEASRKPVPSAGGHPKRLKESEHDYRTLDPQYLGSHRCLVQRGHFRAHLLQNRRW